MATEIIFKPEEPTEARIGANEAPLKQYESGTSRYFEMPSFNNEGDSHTDNEVGQSRSLHNPTENAQFPKKFSQSILDLEQLDDSGNLQNAKNSDPKSGKHRRLLKFSEPVSPINVDGADEKVNFSDLVSPPDSATRRTTHWSMYQNQSLSLKIQTPLTMGVINEEFTEQDGENSPKLKPTRSKNSTNSAAQVPEPGQLDENAPESTTRKRIDKTPSSNATQNEYADDTTYRRRHTESFSLQDRYYMEFESAYSFRTYALFYLLHMLHHNVFGPFFALFAFPFKPLRIASYNMQFGFKFGAGDLLLFAMFGINLLTKIGYFFLDFKVTNYVSVYLDILTLSGVSSLIAAKYATFPKKMVQRVFSEQIPMEERRREEQFGDWQHQTHEIVNSEYRVAMARNKFDTGVFWMQFLFDLSPRIKKELEDFKKSGFLNFDPVKKIKTRGGKERVYYSGKAIFFALVNIHHTEKKSSAIYWNVIICGMFWGFSPMMSRYLCDLPIINPESKLDTACLFLHSVVMWLMFYYQNSFYIRAMIDVSRVKFMMEELRHMLSKNTGMGETKRMFPPINFIH